MKKILLSQNKYTIVDDDDFDWLNQWKWYCDRVGYAVRHKTRNKIVSMHREILNPPKHLDIDHINGNALDNRRANLRVCTTSQNLCNSRKQKNNTSGYKGVSWHKKTKKWRAYISVRSKNIYLGYFTNKKTAARVYDIAAQTYHGEFAKLNFPRVSRLLLW